jgi:hypothetical protein
MTKIFPKFWRKTAADEVIHQIHELRRRGKLNNINPQEEKELGDAIKSKFPNDRFIDTRRLYKEVFKPLGHKNGDLLDPKEIAEVGEKIGLKEDDLDNFRDKHGLRQSNED